MSGLISDTVLLALVAEAIHENGIDVEVEDTPNIVPAYRLVKGDSILERIKLANGRPVIHEYKVTDIHLYACNSRGTHVTVRKGDDTFQWCYDRLLGMVELKS